MSENYRKRPFDGTSAFMVVFFIGLFLVLVTYGSLQLGSLLAFGSFVHGHPVTVMTGVTKGEVPWPWQSTVLVSVLMLAVICTTAFLLMRRILKGPKPKVHKQAQHLGRGKELSKAATARKVAAGKLADANTVIGLLIAKTIQGAQELWASWRDGMVIIMGPGMGKTTAVAIPLISQAPGLVFGTSNKRDLVDGIRKMREAVGRLWAFDPQRIADYFRGGYPTWWWNPLSYLMVDFVNPETGALERRGSETRAVALAKLFASNDREEGARTDPFFDKEGPHLLARLMLAAAVDGKYLPQVFMWLNKSKDREPINILRKHNLPLTAAALEESYNWAEEQRQGVFATARAAIEFLDNQDALTWISPIGENDQRVQFSPERFVRSRQDTLFSLSKEGDGSFGPITAALTKAVLDAAEEYAAREGGGRMPVPMLGMLDEAANCCKISDLPKKYSFYGSYGIFLVTILQNWTQGVSAWSENGMRSLWAAATHRVIGGGVEDMDFLEKISKRLGDHDVKKYTTSSSSGRNHSTSVGSNISKEPIMSGSKLASLPYGTIIMLPSGGEGIMASCIPYWERSEEIKAVVDASFEQYRPKVQVQAWN